MKKYKNISAKENKEDKENLKEKITLQMRGTILSYIAKGYSIETITKVVSEVAEELKTDVAILEFKKDGIRDDRA